MRILRLVEEILRSARNGTSSWQARLAAAAAAARPFNGSKLCGLRKEKSLGERGWHTSRPIFIGRALFAGSQPQIGLYIDGAAGARRLCACRLERRLANSRRISPVDTIDSILCPPIAFSRSFLSPRLFRHLSRPVVVVVVCLSALSLSRARPNHRPTGTRLGDGRPP